MSARFAVALSVVAVAVPAGLAASKASSPGPPSGATRVQAFRVNLDRDGTRERVYVYRMLVSGASTSFLDVWNKRRPGGWKRAQHKRVSTSPGAPGSGLVKAWVGDLNRDHRVEIAVRDFLTPSAGEVLSLYRQKRRYRLRFKRLQSIGGDTVRVAKKAGKRATIRRFIKSNHSTDGVAHHEVWRWSKGRGKWVCRVDCMP